MKNPIISLFLACVGFMSAIAQPLDGPEGKEDRIEALKVGFITKQLNLTTEEAQKFWPVYNQYASELKTLRQGSMAMRKMVKENGATLSDGEAEKVADEFVTMKKNEYELVAKYHKQFKGVLPARKVMLLYKSENQFKQRLLEEIRDNRPPHHPGGPPPRGGGPTMED